MRRAICPPSKPSNPYISPTEEEASFRADSDLILERLVVIMSNKNGLYPANQLATECSFYRLSQSELGGFRF